MSFCLHEIGCDWTEGIKNTPFLYSLSRALAYPAPSGLYNLSEPPSFMRVLTLIHNVTACLRCLLSSAQSVAIQNSIRKVS